MSRHILPSHIAAYACFLRQEERAPATIEKYQRDVRAFAAWLGDRELEAASGWREYLLKKGYAPFTINSMLSAVNRFLKFLGRGTARSGFCASSARRSGTKSGN